MWSSHRLPTFGAGLRQSLVEDLQDFTCSCIRLQQKHLDQCIDCSPPDCARSGRRGRRHQRPRRHRTAAPVCKAPKACLQTVKASCHSASTETISQTTIADSSSVQRGSLKERDAQTLDKKDFCSARRAAQRHGGGARLTDFGLKSHVQQSVSLVQYQPAKLGGVEGRCALQVVEEPPGGGHQHRHSLPQPRLLLVAVLSTRDGPANLAKYYKLTSSCHP